MELRVPVSPEQEEVIADHLFKGTELGLLPGERAWMIGQARKVHAGCRIKAADLDIENATWVLTLDGV